MQEVVVVKAWAASVGELASFKPFSVDVLCLYTYIAFRSLLCSVHRVLIVCLIRSASVLFW